MNLTSCNMTSSNSVTCSQDLLFLQHMKYRIASFFVLIFILCSISLVQAQPKRKPADYGISSKKALKFYEEGLQQAHYRDRIKAMAAFEEAIRIEPEFAHAHYQLGINAYVKKQYEEALPHLETAYQIMPDAFNAIDFYLGETYFYNEKYALAAEKLQTFIEKGVGRKVDVNKAKANLRHATFAAEAIKDSLDFQPLNLGKAINTDKDEYLPFLTADDAYLLFTSRRPQSIGGYNAMMQNYSEDFFYSRWEDSAWTKAENLGTPINTRDNEGAASITQDGRTIFFTACNRQDGYGGCDIYVAFREGNRWSRPQNLGPNVNGEGWDAHPCLSGDGKTLYFASRRQNGQGGSDIWASKFVDGEWMPAVNLGASINSKGNEDSPFLHADDISLYFSSDYHPGFGGQDIFVSFLEDGNWSKPRNLGYPLNTSAFESHLFVNSTGRKGFINSDREGGLGGSDLYQFDLDRKIRPKIATFLRGIVRDSLNSKPLQAQIRLVDLATGDTVREAFTESSKGSFLLSLPLEKEYAAFVEAKGYLFTTKHFYLKDQEETPFFDLIIEMQRLEKDVQVTLRNIFFEFGSYELAPTSEPELKFLYDFLQRNPQIRIEIQGHTDDVGTETANLELSQNRADAVRTYLINKGLPESRIEARGYGESMPVSGNITDEDRARNRRTEFKILEVK